MNTNTHIDNEKLSKNDPEKLLGIYRRAFSKLAKYFESVFPGYKFRFEESVYASYSKCVYFKVMRPKSKKWVIIDHYPNVGINTYTEAYEAMRKFLCRNMAIKIDDYHKIERNDSIELTYVEENSRVEKFIMLPCYDSIIEMVMKLGLKGIDLS